mmetsp:Transcript_20594/g.64773  ORF Transcript_20594/g.64773 Transcript_20594/m.64773 type:complete len:226 (+) Transcript_20594:384-1061(+)
MSALASRPRSDFGARVRTATRAIPSADNPRPRRRREGSRTIRGVGPGVPPRLAAATRRFSRPNRGRGAEQSRPRTIRGRGGAARGSRTIRGVGPGDPCGDGFGPRVRIAAASRTIPSADDPRRAPRRRRDPPGPSAAWAGFWRSWEAFGAGPSRSRSRPAATRGPRANLPWARPRLELNWARDPGARIFARGVSRFVRGSSLGPRSSESRAGLMIFSLGRASRCR